MKRFNKINIEISNICNLQCSFCPAVIRSPKLMSLELFQKIINQVAPLTEQVCFHLMGDPLVHPELEKMVLYCNEKKVPVFFVTNGVLLKQNFEKKLSFLLNPTFRQINFSLHSFADNFGDKDPTDYLEKIFRFTEIALEQRPELYLNYRLWNLQEARSSTSGNKIILQKIEEHFGFKAIQQIDVRKNKSHKIKNRLYLHYDTEFIWPSLDLPFLGQKGTCYGLNSHFGILVDGTVVPCCLDKEGAIPLGKIDDQPLQEILDSPKARAISDGFKKNKLVESLCQRCQYIERFQS